MESQREGRVRRWSGKCESDRVLGRKMEGREEDKAGKWPCR